MVESISAEFSAGTSEAQGSLTTTFTADDIRGTSYEWDYGDGSSGTTTGYTTSHTFSVASSYTVTLTAFLGVESDTDTVSVRVWPNSDYNKVIVCTDDGGDSGQTTTIESISTGATAIYRQESLSTSIVYAKQNGYGVICRPTTGLDDSRINNEGADAAEWNIVVVHAHHSNTHEYSAIPSFIGDIWAVRDNDGSYGPGVEFTIPTVTTESDATGTLAGYVSKFMSAYAPTISELRTIFRNTASNSGVHFDADGYGAVDYSAVEAELEG